MNEIKVLPAQLQSKSLSKTEIILDYLDSLLAIEILKSNNLLILGYEVLINNKVICEYVYNEIDIKNWDSLVMNAYAEILQNLCKDYNIYNKYEMNDNTIYYSITAINKDEFEMYYNDFINVD